MKWNKEEEIDIAEEKKESEWEETIAQGVSDQDEQEKDYVKPLKLTELKDIIDNSLKKANELIKLIDTLPDKPNRDFTKYKGLLDKLIKDFSEWKKKIDAEYKNDPKKTTIHITTLRDALESLEMKIIKLILP